MKKLKSNLKEPNKIPVTFKDKQWRFIEKYKGLLGDKRAEIVRNIALNWILSKEEKAIK